MYKIGEEEMVICPYNRYHVVSKLRIQKHITKCKKNYPDLKLSTCFYNYCHRLNPENMLAHYGVCSHKIRVEGTRYDTDYYASTNSIKGDQRSKKFPDINVKPNFFCNYFTSPSCSSAHISCENKLDSSDSDSELEKSTLKVEFSDDNSHSDDESEPLPLPKTVSKAFMCARQKPNTLLSATAAKTSESKGFGRAKNFLVCPPPKPSRTTEHLLPDLKNLDSGLPEKGISFRTFSNNLVPTSSSASIVSSMFDDISTFNSEEIISDKEDNYGNKAKNFIFKNFDKYTKL